MTLDPPPKVMLSERFILSVQERTLYGDGEPVKIGARALEILLVLAERPGQLVSKQELLARVWPNQHVDETALRVHLSALRRLLLSDGEDRKLIVNENGRGYRLACQSMDPLDLSHGCRKIRSTLPVALSSMVGRDAIEARCRELLEARRFLTLTGPGGVGKTALSLAVAAAFSAEHALPVLFLDLAQMTDATHIHAELARQLGLPDEVDACGFAEVAGSTRLLLVLDTCEHLIEAAAAFAETMLGTLPNLVILATSREALRAAGEAVLQVPPLALPQDPSSGSGRQLVHVPAIRLFIDRAEAVCPAFSPSPHDLAQIAHICRALDGMPLAIEMAAARLATHTLPELSAMLLQGMTVLSHGRRTAPARHRTWAACLEWSLETLSEEEQHVLQGLCVFGGSFSLKDAIDVLGDGHADVCALIDTVASLAAKSMLSVTRDGAEMRYRLLKIVRQDGLRRSAGGAAWRQACHNHARHVLGRVRAKRSRLRDHAPDNLPTFVEEIRVALSWAGGRHGDPQLATALARSASCLLSDQPLPLACLDLRDRRLPYEAVPHRSLVRPQRSTVARRPKTPAAWFDARPPDTTTLFEPRLILADLG